MKCGGAANGLPRAALPYLERYISEERPSLVDVARTAASLAESAVR